MIKLSDLETLRNNGVNVDLLIERHLLYSDDGLVIGKMPPKRKDKTDEVQRPSGERI